MAKMNLEKVEYEDVRKEIRGRIIAQALGESDEQYGAVMKDFWKCEADITDVDRIIQDLKSAHVAGVYRHEPGGPRRYVSRYDGSASSGEEFAGKERFRRKKKLRSSVGSWRSGDDSDKETITMERRSIAEVREDKVPGMLASVSTDPVTPNSCSTCGKLWHTAESCWAGVICQWCNRRGHIASACHQLSRSLGPGTYHQQLPTFRQEFFRSSSARDWQRSLKENEISTATGEMAGVLVGFSSGRGQGVKGRIRTGDAEKKRN